MRSVSFRPVADRDLAEIWQFTAANWGRTQADDYIATIRRTIEGLSAKAEHNPHATHLHPGLRKARSGAHLIYYIADDTNVDIVRILHCKRDVQSLL